jgi:hypothetical protein
MIGLREVEVIQLLAVMLSTVGPKISRHQRGRISERVLSDSIIE